MRWVGIFCVFLFAASCAPEYDAYERKCGELASSPVDSGRFGNGVAFDQIAVSEALPYCEQAVRRHPSKPRNHFQYGRVLDASKKYEEARTQYLIAAKAGMPVAAYNLGLLYHLRNKDYENAFRWYQRAAEGGYAEGFSAIAMLYVQSEPPNYSEAAKWNRKGVDAGSPVACANLGWQHQFGAGVPQDIRRAADLYGRGSRAGNRDAMYFLGLLYYRGEGVSQDLPHAAELLQGASERGHHDAQDFLGEMLLHGRGVPRNESQALKWFSQAAQAGQPDAQFWMGAIYDSGLGVTADRALAVSWYRKSAGQNDADAMTQLGFHLRQGEGTAWNEMEAMQWFRKAAEMGNADAQAALGWGYMHGLGGGPQDYGAAAAWLGKAAKQGSAAAQLNLGVLYERGWGVSQDLDQARALYLQASGSPYAEISSAARAYASNLPVAASRPALDRDDKDALIGGAVALLGLIAVGELLGGPSSPQPSRQQSAAAPARTGGSADREIAESQRRADEESRRILSDHFAAERQQREAAAQARQEERDRHTQRCGFTPKVNCF